MRETFRADRTIYRYLPWLALVAAFFQGAAYVLTGSSPIGLAALLCLVLSGLWFRWARGAYAVLEACNLTVYESPMRHKSITLSEIDRWMYRAYLDRIEFVRDMRHPIEVSVSPLSESERERLLHALASRVPGEIEY